MADDRRFTRDTLTVAIGGTAGAIPDDRLVSRDRLNAAFGVTVGPIPDDRYATRDMLTALLAAQVPDPEPEPEPEPVVTPIVLGDPFTVTEETTGAGGTQAQAAGYSMPTQVLAGTSPFYVPNGETIENRIINGRVIMQGTSSLINCIVRGTVTAPTGEIPLVLTSSATMATIRYVTVQPQTPSSFWSGIGNSNYTAEYCKVLDCTDSFRASKAGLAKVLAVGCFSADMVQFRPDQAINRAETHNDIVQLGGNTGDVNDVVYDTCWFDARHNRTKSTQPYNNTRYANPGNLTGNYVNLAVFMCVPAQSPKISATFKRSVLLGGIATINMASRNPGGQIVVADCLMEKPADVTPGNAWPIWNGGGLNTLEVTNTRYINAAKTAATATPIVVYNG